MGFTDAVTKAYIRENTVFADAFNYLLYDGKQIIKPENLHTKDITEIAIPFHPEGKISPRKLSKSATQKYRDIFKSTVVMNDDEASYILLGIENQSEVHYAMPVRNAIYDALQYGQQVNDIAAQHRKHNELSSVHTRGEYLSGFLKDDTIAPVITLVIYFGLTPWDGPRSLHEMMAVKNQHLLSFVPDYQIHLLEPHCISDNDLQKFSTNLREVMGYIKYANDKQKLAAFIHDNPRMIIERNAAMVISTATHTTINIPEKEASIDMCKAIEEMLADAIAEGKNAGLLEGKAAGLIEGKSAGLIEGKAAGLIEGKSAGLIEGQFKSLAELVKDKLLDINEAAKRANMSVEEFEEKMYQISK